MLGNKYVSYEIAKLLGEKGFSEWCEFAYTSEHDTIDLDCYDYGHSNTLLIPKGIYAAPKLVEVQEWFRENHSISLEPEVFLDGKKWRISITNFYLGVVDRHSPFMFKSFEEALEEGIRFEISLIIN